MEVGGQCDAVTGLQPSTHCRDGWVAPQPVWTLFRRVSSCSCWEL